MAGSYEAILDEAFAAAPAAPLWAKISFAESRTYMHDVLLRDTDQMSMAHGLEVRVPLLDHHLAQYVVGLPDAIKRHGGGVKPLLAASVPLPLPPTITATSKRGFVLPLDAWMRGPLRPFCERALGPDGLEGRGVFEPAALRAVWARFLEGGRGMTWSRVWTLVALASWLDRHEIEIVQP
jgi:asparagine synthase (glutamine-hydrolysing)